LLIVAGTLVARSRRPRMAADHRAPSVSSGRRPATSASMRLPLSEDLASSSPFRGNAAAESAE